MGLIQQIRLYPISALKTALISLSFFSFGMTASMTGPTLLDLQVQVQTTLDMITLVLPVRSFGNVLGCVGCKQMKERRTNPQKIFSQHFIQPLVDEIEI